MSQWGDGRDDGPGPERADAVPREPAAHELPDIAPWRPGLEGGAPTGIDPVGVVAVAAGFIGIVVFGILLALVAGILGGVAGQRARESGRSLELAYLAFLLAGIDGVVWIVLHLLFDVSFQIG